MVDPSPHYRKAELNQSPSRLVAFNISGGIFQRIHRIVFPTPPESGAAPGILILSGRNGSGKTAILRMISGLIADLNFDPFRQIPFSHASLEFSDGRSLAITKTENPEYPLSLKFGDFDCVLYKERGVDQYSAGQQKKIAAFREAALPVVSQINFEFLDIHRSAALKQTSREEDDWLKALRGQVKPSPTDRAETLSDRVRRFMADAQVNYRRFFAAEELELLPRIVERFHAGDSKRSTPSELSDRVAAVQKGFAVMRRFGLQTDDADLKTLGDLLRSEYARNEHSLTLMEAYVEMQESRQKARQLIATRLVEFEQIMDEFLSGKSVRIDARSGLSIVADKITLKETDLSSGEYHFLYMMVAALLCQRSGSIIAIDEPELSLHVMWQRKVLSALARCAARASPVFLFATHSPAISAEHADKVYHLTPLE